MKAGQSMQKYVKMLPEVFDEMSIIGDPLDEENQEVHLLASLPESFDMLWQYFKQGQKSSQKYFCTKKSSRETRNPLP